VTGGGGKGGGGKGGSTFTMAQFESQQATIQERAIDAEPSASTADDVKYAKAELALIRRALAELSLTRDQRVALKQRRNALLADLASIEQQDEQEAQAIRDKRDAARKAARAKREAREKAEQEAEANHMDKVMKRAQAHYDRMAKLTKGTDFSTRKGLRAAALRYVDKDGKPKATGDDKPPTAGEIARMLHDFASGLHGVIGSYAGNVGDSPADYGMMGTQSQLQTMELAKQTQILENFTGAVRHPFTGYHRTEGTTTLLGVGF
jgi:multidrug efflux pump subunit AcrA (membrane-fusion protein)